MEASRTENSSKTAFSGIINKILTLILAFISRKIFIQFIGIEYLGINGLFANILTLLSLADLGFGVAMNYSLYKPLAMKDEKTLAALIGFYRKIYNIIAISVAILGLCLTPFLKFIINLDSNIPYVQGYYLIYLANTVISYLFVYKSSIINADQKGYKVNTVNTGINIGKVILQIICIIIFKSYAVYALIEVLATLTNNVLISSLANKLYPYILNDVPLNDDQKRNIFTNLKSVFIYKLSGNIMTGTDSILMSVLVSTAAVGLYSNYLTITTTITTMITIIFSSVTAAIGNLLVDRNTNNRLNVFKIIQMVGNFLSTYIGVCILILAQEFISLWIGAQYKLDYMTVIAISLNLYFTICMQPLWTFRDASGLYQKTKYVMLVTAILNIILSILLGKIYGVAGIVIATALSRLLTYFWYEPKLLFEIYFEKKSLGYYIDAFFNIMLMGICYFISNIVCQYIELYNGWIQWICKAIACSIIVIVIYFLRYFWTKEFLEMIKKLKKLLEKTK